ncbi:hypothetical protein U1707_08545 [Sphingomonas sp. PB2P12]|uniref:hypothetical protein n=1 Tax=Sphingomonas sandaracina TaxID=3096157 RepID=UPI002FCB8FCF
MADFDDSIDPELGEACNRLAAWVEPLPEGQVIDQASGLTERDLAMILRRLHETRKYSPISIFPMDEAGERSSRPSVPVTKKGPWT